jgi:hypothetical protein
MTNEEALQTLLRHGPGLPGDESESFGYSLLAQELPKEEHFWDIVRATYVIAPNAINSTTIDKRVCYALWEIYDSAITSVYGENRLPKAAKTELEDWARCIASISMGILRDQDIRETFLPVSSYLAASKSTRTGASFLIPLFEDALNHLVSLNEKLWDDDIINLIITLGRLGQTASKSRSLIQKLSTEHPNDEIRNAAEQALMKLKT